jgi:hypothetical protein
MKLTNQQIDALVNKIYDEIHADIISQCNSDMAIIKKRFEKTKEYQAMNLINAAYTYQAVNPLSLMSRLYDLPKQNNGSTKLKIKNEIILSTIDCVNLDELIEKVKASVAE